MENPFQFGRELGAGELVDREEEIAQVARTIRHGGKLFLVGPRRYGKTSVLKAAEDRLLSEGAVVLRCDAGELSLVRPARSQTDLGSGEQAERQCRADWRAHPGILCQAPA